MPTEIDRQDVPAPRRRRRTARRRHARAEWEESHLVGAVHVPLKKLAELAPERLDPTRAVITYCYDSL